jgi:autoinducer 2 (AI-2) kinase
MRHLLAIDAGTGSGRAVIFDENGKQIAAANREWFHRSDSRYPGSMDFDRNGNWELLVACIRESCAQVPNLNIAAISTTSMGEAFVVYDEKGDELWACANVDARAIEQVQALRSADPGLEHRQYLRSGQTFALGAAPRLLWIKQHEPELYQRAKSISMLNDWIAYRLGAPIVVEPSNSGTAGVFNLFTRKWDVELAEECGINPSLFSAPVHQSGSIIGSVSQSAAEQSGLRPGIPIVVGGRDAQLGSIGVGAVLPGQAAVFGGTFWQQEVNLGEPISDPSGRIRMDFHAVPGVWQAETIVFFPGFAARWFRDAICPDIKALAEQNHRDPYEILEEMASGVPAGSYGIIPIFSDAMNYSHWRHAAPSFLNLSVDPSVASRAALFRSLEENAAIVTLANLRRISELTHEFPSHVIFASGASKGSLWCQILADVLQIPVHTRVVKEATALGAAICAGVGIGLYSGFSEAVEQVVKEERVYQPDNQKAAIYQDLYERWLAAYPIQLELADRGVTSHLWRAPGE